MPIDSTGRPLMVGDLLRCDHFTAAKRRKVYMYKIAIRANAAGEMRADGDYWYAAHLNEVVAKGISKAWRCRIEALDHFEVIDGPAIETENGLECWWERQKEKVPRAE